MVAICFMAKERKKEGKKGRKERVFTGSSLRGQGVEVCLFSDASGAGCPQTSFLARGGYVLPHTLLHGTPLVSLSLL